MMIPEMSLMEGSIRKSMMWFAFPIFLGNLFQQLYNMADAIIVGNYAGDIALAAVTSTGTLVFLFTGFFIGMYQGMGVVIARYYGAKDEKSVKDAINTAVIFGALSGIVLLVCGVMFSRLIVELVGTPTEVYGQAVTYLRVFFVGSFFTALYNTMCGICRALGDSKRPLYYLVVASIVNVILDFIFVGGFGMGVVGAALATVLAQGISAVLSYYRLTHLEDYSFEWKLMRDNFSANLLKQMISIGLPSGIQNSVIGFANVVVQASINSFGTVVMAGNGAYFKLQGLVFLPIESFSMAITTFVSQNIGAGQIERVRKGARFGVIFACSSAEILGVIAILTAPFLIGMFGSGADAVAVGVMKIYIDAIFYWFLAYAHSVSAVMRGAGHAKSPMFIMLGIWCVMRVIYIQCVMYFTNDVFYVFLAYPITWITSGVLFLLAYRKCMKGLSINKE